MILTLPWWPDQLKANRGKGLPPKVRGAIAKKYKHDCMWAAKADGLGTIKADGLKLTFTFCPKPHGPAPDRDNCMASCKALIDGIAEITGINDRHFTYGEPQIGARVKGGAVTVEIEL